MTRGEAAGSVPYLARCRWLRVSPTPGDPFCFATVAHIPRPLPRPDATTPCISPPPSAVAMLHQKPPLLCVNGSTSAVCQVEGSHQNGSFEMPRREKSAPGALPRTPPNLEHKNTRAPWSKRGGVRGDPTLTPCPDTASPLGSGGRSQSTHKGSPGTGEDNLPQMGS